MGETALMKASIIGCDEIVKLLITNGGKEIVHDTNHVRIP